MTTPEENWLSEPDWQSVDHIDLAVPAEVTKRPGRTVPLR